MGPYTFINTIWIATAHIATLNMIGSDEGSLMQLSWQEMRLAPPSWVLIFSAPQEKQKWPDFQHKREPMLRF